MENQVKLIIAGPVGAGKTTFIRTLSQIEVVDTDAIATEDIGKVNTTVAMDYGNLHIGDTLLHLFGTPGQDRFDFMWEVLCEGALGLVLLISGIKPKDLPQARRILEFITSRIAVPFILGVTHQDAEKVWTPEDIADYFELPIQQVVGINALNASDNLLLLIKLLEILEERL